MKNVNDMKNTKYFICSSIICCFVWILFVNDSQARERRSVTAPRRRDVTRSSEKDEQGRRVVYRKKSVVDFDSMLLEGDIKNPNEFYFVHRPEEKFGTLVKKRPNFHKEMLRDAVMTR